MLSLGSLGPLKTPNCLTPASLAAGAAIAYELHALDHPEPDLTPQVNHAWPSEPSRPERWVI